jgi:hypothetical protein
MLCRTPAASAVRSGRSTAVSVPYPWLVGRRSDTFAITAEYFNLPRDRTVIVGSQAEV